MDRRRFVPSADGLEGRALLSLLGGSAPSSSSSAALGQIPENFEQKIQRIENLPFFVDHIQPGRFIPPEAMKDIQANLLKLAGTLHAPPSMFVNGFNENLRHAMPYSTLSPDTARILNHSFSVVLTQAGADPGVVEALAGDMNVFALAASRSVNPSFLARNDYALVLQTALAVGRPIPTPTTPTLSVDSGQAVKGAPAGYTHQQNPTLVGTYPSGATTEGSTTMQVLDESGQVVGSGAVDSAGRYSAKITTALPDGTHAFTVRAVDPFGHLSKPSRPFTLKVISRPDTPTAAAQTLVPPGGPRGLR